MSRQSFIDAPSEPVDQRCDQYRPTCLLRIAFGIAVVFLSSKLNGQPTSQKLVSPHNQLSVRFVVGTGGTLVYSVDRLSDAVILPSALGLSPEMESDLAIVSSKQTQHRGSWKPLYGERSLIPDDYNALSIVLKNRVGKTFSIEFRAYDEGAAFRYGTSTAMEASSELTEFRVPEGSKAYEEHGGTEGEYHLSPIDQIAPLCQAPLTVALHNGTYASILEAANTNFPTMTLRAEHGKTNTLQASLGGEGKLPANGFTPWRLIMAAQTPGELLEHDFLQLDLNQPQALKDTSWIVPGTVMREMTLSDDGAYKTINFAAAHRIPYILFDGGWYGQIDYEKGDASHERTQDAKGNPAPPLHIQDIVKYGRLHGVGVFLYIDHKQVEKQRDILFPLYQQWGVAGVKIGFIDVGTQQNTDWLIETIQRAADSHLMLDIHDQYRTTGYTRTYPNLLTVEGIRGNEHFPTSEHNATVPFTRYLAGSADYTICYYADRLKNSHAHQLAMAVISYSPMQSILWYDQPKDFHGEPEIRWFEGLPTVWDETRVLLGEIGRYAVIARRSGDAWYVAAIGDGKGNTLHLPLSFLNRNSTYESTMYTDDDHVNTATHVAVDHRQLKSTDFFDLVLQPDGGVAIYLAPANSRAQAGAGQTTHQGQ